MACVRKRGLMCVEGALLTFLLDTSGLEEVRVFLAHIFVGRHSLHLDQFHPKRSLQDLVRSGKDDTERPCSRAQNCRDLLNAGQNV